jgi:(R,R)-butanediol dehydrogenase / meso-butanediol dehydrogenase / diacetyl reductase
MRAVVFQQEGQPLAVEDRQTPTARPGDLVLRVACCGICGSDLHATEPSPTPLDRGTVLGHEFSGIVTESGSPDFQPGDRVIGLPLQECEECRPQCEECRPLGTGCKDGLGILCGRNRIIGLSAGAPGAYAEYVRLPASQALRIPDGLDLRLAALTEPLAVGAHAVGAAGPLLGKRVLVVGAGPIGLAVTMFAGLSGARRVVVSEMSPARRALAGQFGAEVIDPTDAAPTSVSDTQAGAFARIAGGPPDVIFECVGVPGVLRQCMDIAPLHGCIVVVGVCRQEDTVLPRVGIRKELSLQFVLGYTRAEFALVLDLLAAGRLAPASMITGVIGLDEVPAVFEALRRPGPHAKVLIDPSR